MLGVLRDTETGEPASAPLPTWADCRRWSSGPARQGCTWSSRTGSTADVPLPDVVGRTIYRIVQEGITNAAKHAPAGGVAHRGRGSPDDGIDITLRNPIGFGPTGRRARGSG